MLWVSAAILFFLWVAALIVHFTAGGFIHLLAILAVAFLLVQLIEAGGRGSGNRPQNSNR